ncbi:MAG: hypothetical protein EBR10_11030 [Planctomycetes bacterium]|nr:hypothetical protein [Planctomycetota bacterium]
MEPTELLRLVGEQLDRVGCQRFTTGSVASMVFGEPRFTNDIDIVVRMDERQARLVVAAFVGEDWYASADAAVEAARQRSMFNIIHVPSGLKADIIVAAGGAFDASRFSRVRHIELPDGRLEPFASPEDVILKKLEFFRAGGSQKHLRDVASMIAVQGAASFDWPYLEHWAKQLGVAAELDLVRSRREG